jgi:hypothetical protein
VAVEVRKVGSIFDLDLPIINDYKKVEEKQKLAYEVAPDVSFLNKLVLWGRFLTDEQIELEKDNQPEKKDKSKESSKKSELKKKEKAHVENSDSEDMQVPVSALDKDFEP